MYGPLAARIPLQQGSTLRLDHVSDARPGTGGAGGVQRRQSEAHVAEETGTDEQQPVGLDRRGRWGFVHASAV